ncbi:MAG: RHS repeat-associated core domain-containing protein [Solirubrobacteraceae bacterium]
MTGVIAVFAKFAGLDWVRLVPSIRSLCVGFALAQAVLVTSAVACEGVGGPPVSPDFPTVGGAGLNPGAPALPQQLCGKTVNCATGDEAMVQADTVIGGRGLGLNVARSYDAQVSAAAQAEDAGVGLWGWGWTGPYGTRLVLAISEVGQQTATVQQQNGSAVTFYKNEKGEYEAGGWVQASFVKEGSNYIYTLPEQAALEFNSEGELVKETDRNGNSTTLVYNGSKQLEKVTDSTGRSLSFKYNAEGLVESIKDPIGHVVSYTYTAKGGLADVSIEGKVRWKFGYTATAPYLLSSVTDGRGHAITIEYDSSHRVIKETEAGHERKWSYGTNETTITEPNGAETVDTFNTADEPTKVIEAKGTSAEKVTEYEYNGTTFELTKMTDPNKHVTEYGYDTEGNRTSETDPNGDERKWEYDKDRNVVKETSPEGEITTIKRSEAGQPEMVERPIGSETQKTEYKYDAYGDVTEVVDPLGNKTKYTYDAYGDKESEKDAEGNERKWKYNEDSQETEETSPRGYVTKTERNDYGLPTKITDPLGHATEYKYDANQNVESETNGNTHTTKYEYNDRNLPIKVVKPNGDTTETGYDAEGEKTSYTDGNGHTWEYKHNQLGQVTEEKNPLGKVWKKTYNKAGYLEKLEDPERKVTEYTYDETNRLKKIKHPWLLVPDESPNVTYEYNKDSKVTKMEDETYGRLVETTNNTWDKLDRLTKYVNDYGHTVAYEYNLANLPVKITYPNGKSITRSYDKDNRLAKVTDWSSREFSFKYNADGKPITTTFPALSEDKDEYAYNEADQMTEIKMLWGSTSIAKLVYERDGDGQVIKATENVAEGASPATVTSVLDENNRLIEHAKHAYTYDKANNPTEIEGEAGYTYNEADQLKESPTAKYSYNEDGQRSELNPKSGEFPTTYKYNQAGLLGEIYREMGPKQTEIESTFYYDGNGLPLGAQTEKVWDGLTWDTAEPLPLLLSEELYPGSEESYVYGPEGLPLEKIAGQNAVYLHHDQQGSTRVITYWLHGQVVGWRTYSPYGKLIEVAGDPVLLGYDGQVSDEETGLISLGARRQDPATGQFMSIDPAIESTGEPYSYGQDNPENRTDPTGMCSFRGSLMPTMPPINWYEVANACVAGSGQAMVSIFLKGSVIVTAAAATEPVGLTGFAVAMAAGCVSGAAIDIAKQIFAKEPGALGRFNRALIETLDKTLTFKDASDVMLEGPEEVAQVWKNFAGAFYVYLVNKTPGG